MQGEMPEIAWFVSASYGVSFAILTIFVLLTLWRRQRAKSALRVSGLSIQP